MCHCYCHVNAVAFLVSTLILAPLQMLLMLVIYVVVTIDFKCLLLWSFKVIYAIVDCMPCVNAHTYSACIFTCDKLLNAKQMCPDRYIAFVYSTLPQYRLYLLMWYKKHIRWAVIVNIKLNETRVLKIFI